MSLRVRRFLMLSSLFVFFSCNKERRNEDRPAYSDLHSVSINIIGTELYPLIYQSASDSLDSFSSNKLSGFKDITGTSWKLDSLIVFNKSKDKCVMAFYVQYGEGVSNGVNYLYGISIKRNWYFFRGPHLYIPSEGYGYSKNTPLPFPKLHEIAMGNIFKGYLKKGKGGKWEINDGFFARFYERDAYNFPFTTQETWEESWLKLMRENWRKRDTTNYDSFQ